MSFKVFEPKSSVSENDTPGQSWLHESIEENIALCKYQTITPYFYKYLPKNGCILEAGCGLGRWVFYLKEKGYNILGIELSNNAIKAIRNYNTSAPIEQGDITKMPYDDNSFDAVISLGVIEHFEEGPNQVLLEMKRVLRENGVLILTVPILNLLRRLYTHRLISLKHLIRSLQGRGYIFAEYRYTKREIMGFLKATRFELLEAFPDDFISPKNIGLFVDFPFLQNKNRKWELNRFGRVVDNFLRSISLELHTGGYCFIARALK